MQFGVYIIGLFAVIFLIYSNSFLAKRRKKEFGLFSDPLAWKRNIFAKVLFFESLYLWILSVGGGILLGILCYKLLFLVLLKLTRLQGTIHFAFHWKLQETRWFICRDFLINYLKSLHQIHAAQPIELLHGEQEGERERKRSFLPHGSDCSVWDLVIIWH